MSSLFLLGKYSCEKWIVASGLFMSLGLLCNFSFAQVKSLPSIDSVKTKVTTELQKKIGVETGFKTDQVTKSVDQVRKLVKTDSLGKKILGNLKKNAGIGADSLKKSQIKASINSANPFANTDALGKKVLGDFKKKVGLEQDSIKKGSLIKTAFDKNKEALKNKVKDQYGLSGDSIKKYEAINALANKKLEALNLKKNSLRDSIKKAKPIRLNNLAIENSTLASGNAGTFKRENILNTISVFGQVQLFTFPLAIDLSNNSGGFQQMNPLRDALFKVNLDKSQFRQLYQNDVDKVAKFQKMELSGMDVSTYLKKNISGKLKPSSLLDPSRFQRLNTLLGNEQQLAGLLNLNEQQIKEKLTALTSSTASNATTAIKSQVPVAPVKVNGELNKDNLDAQINALSQNNLLKNADSLKLVQEKIEAQVEMKKEEITEVIISLKHKMEDSGLDQQRLEHLQKFIRNKGSLSDLESIFENEMNQDGKYSQVGKFYSKIKAMQVGDFGQRMPGIMNKEMLINGFNFVVKTGRGPVNMGLGVHKDVGMPKDANFEKSLYDFPKLLTYVSIPTTNFAFGSGKLSWVGAFDKQQSNGFSQLNSLPKSNMAFMVSQDMNMHSLGKLTVELSKSGTQYKNIGTMESDKILLNNDLKMGNYFRDDFMETLSIGLKHGIDIKKLGFSGNTFFSYSGLGYQNPGQQGYGSMGMRLGGNVKKSLFKNMIVLTARTDIKNTPISAVSGAHWRNYNLQVDSRVKVSRNYNFNLKYAENGVNKVDGGSNAVYASQKLQVDMNANYKVGSNFGFSRLSVGRQEMLNPAVQTNTNFMTIVYSQNLMMKTISLSGNAFYNKELSGVRMLGDMLNADVSCQYTLLKSLSVSSSFTYLDNQNIARQVGIRENIQVSVLKNFELSAFVDLRKNLINPLYPDLFSTSRGELSIRYFLNK